MLETTLVQTSDHSMINLVRFRPVCQIATAPRAEVDERASRLSGTFRPLGAAAQDVPRAGFCKVGVKNHQARSGSGFNVLCKIWAAPTHWESLAQFGRH